MKPDDPKLTAYPLDELDAAAREEVERLLRDNPEALAKVEDTERLAAQLRRELHAEPAAPLTGEQRAEVLAVAVAGVNDPGSEREPAANLSLRSAETGVNDPGYSRRWSRPLALAASIAVVASAAWVALQSLQLGSARRVAEFEEMPAPALARQPTPTSARPEPQPGLVDSEKTASAQEGALAGALPIAPAMPASPDERRSAAIMVLPFSGPAEMAPPDLPGASLEKVGAGTLAAASDAGEQITPATARDARPPVAEASSSQPVTLAEVNDPAPKPATVPTTMNGGQVTMAGRMGGEGRSSATPQPAKPSAPNPSTAKTISSSTASAAPLAAATRSGSTAVGQNAIDALLFGNGAPVDDPQSKVVARALQKKPAEAAALESRGVTHFAMSELAADSTRGGVNAPAKPDGGKSKRLVTTTIDGVTTSEWVEFEGFIYYGSPIQSTASPLAATALQSSAGTDATQLEEVRATLENLTDSTSTDALSVANSPVLSDGLHRKLEVLRREIRDLEVAEKSLGEVRFQREPSNTESYDTIKDNEFLPVAGNPLSTFSIDVDTASYANVRRFLNEQRLPPKGAVRIEELLNYFDYDYPQPDGEAPFSASMEVAACPWTPEHRLVRIGLKGREIHPDKRPASNLVFLVDVSGSMQPENKLPLVKRCLRQLVDRLSGEDTVAMAVYAGASGCVLESTNKKSEMRAALDRLESGGSTNGAAGIQLAYQLAERSFIKGGVNRVILATDGDFNVGVTNQSDLVDLTEKKAKSGVFLTVLGFGMGNLKDSTLEKLADKGNGNYAYIDTLLEGRKVLIEQMSGTLVTIAKDVKIQVEFNPAQVGSYRLIGYENRMLKKEDFNDDTKDAGEIGAGHTVTALYEVVPAGAKPPTPTVDALKYQQQTVTEKSEISPELLTLKLRYKAPDGDTSKLLESPLTDDGKSYERSSRDFRFAAAVASFGMLLRDSPHKGKANWSSTLELALEGKGEDRSGYRAEFVGLIERARAASR